MRAKRARHPYNRATFSYSPANPWGTKDYSLRYVGEQSEEWLIYDVDPAATPLDVIDGGSGLPQPGDAMEGHDDWLVSRVENLCDTPTVDKQSGYVVWRATVVYVPDPSALPTEIHFASNRVMEVVSHDVDTGEAIVNGAGDPFNPPVQEARGILRVRVIKRYRIEDYDATDILTYEDNQNIDNWIFPVLGTLGPGQVYCSQIDGPLVKEPIWHVQAEFHFDIQDPGNTFNAKLLNCGYQYIDPTRPTGKQKRLFHDDTGVSHGGIGLLKADGTKGDPASPNFLTFQTKPAVDFNDLDLF